MTEHDMTVMPLMIGTAGHVDHGKTALAQHLTGCPLDRHPEAKARGLTIDLGFAPCRLPGDRLVGLIDVPGHEDFIRNMVAGAASIDLLLLVIAADDGVMPQTREHLRIVRLLRDPPVIVAVTKIDLIDDEMRELVLDDIRSFLTEAGLPQAPVLPVSNRTMDGIPELRRTLDQHLAALRPRHDQRHFRMAIERAFNLPGYGTVVTGIPISGTLAVGDEAELYPDGRRHSVRAVQNYKLGHDRARAGMCCAINLRDLEIDAVRRGMWLVAPGCYSPVADLIARRDGAADEGRRRRRMRLHAGTAHCEVSLAPYSDHDPALVRLRLATPMCLSGGDCLLLRSLDQRHSVGAIRVLSLRPMPRRHQSTALAQAVAAQDADEHWAAELLAGGQAIISRAEALALSRLDDAAASARLGEAVDAGLLAPLGESAILILPRRGEVAQQLLDCAQRRHRTRPLSHGLPLNEAAAACGLPPVAWPDLWRALDDIRLVLRHDHLAAADFTPALSARQAADLDRLAAAVSTAGVGGVAMGDLTTTLDLTITDLKRLVHLLVQEERVVRFDRHLLDAAALARCRDIAINLAQRPHGMTVTDFRQASDVPRNLAITLLEYFDAAGLTRRDGDRRVATGRGTER